MGETPTWRVFLSHTADLRRFPQERSYVDAAQEAVIRAGHAVTDMAYFAARDRQPAQVCRDAVAAADIYMVVAGFRYGSPVTDDPQSSYTELEFDAATDVGIPRLVFLLAPDAAGPEDLFSDPEFGARQERFRTRLRNAGLVAVMVNSPAQLEVTLLQALTGLRPGQLRQSDTAPPPTPAPLPWTWVTAGAVATGGVAAAVVAALAGGLVLAVVLGAAFTAALLAVVLGWLRYRAGVVEQAWTRQLDRLWDPLPVDDAGSTREPPPKPTVTTLLSPVAALAPREGRPAELGQLRAWCDNPDASPVHVLAGVAGVGKSRLAVELARALPRTWIAGRCQIGAATRIHAAVAAVGGSRDGALVVVDDADLEPAADIAALIRHTAHEGSRHQPALVRVLLIVRDDVSFAELMDGQLAQRIRRAWESTTLAVLGGPGDRRRYFAHAVQGYLGLPTAASIPAWATPQRSRVGQDGETIVWTHTRAALAVLADDPNMAVAMRTAEPADVAAEILAQERRRWTTSLNDPRWQAAIPLSTQAREEAVLGLLLLAPRTLDDATDVLQRLPRFRARGDDSDLLDNVAAWAHHLYPDPSEWLQPRPSLLHGALLSLAVQPDHASMLAAFDLSAAALADPRVLTRLVRVATGFPAIGELLHQLVDGQAGDAALPRLVEVVLRAGPDGLALQTHLVALLDDRALAPAEIDDLIARTRIPAWRWVHVALHASKVRYLHTSGSNSEAARVTLARALEALATADGQVGNHTAAATATAEAVELYRELVALNRDAYLPNLASSVNNLAVRLAEAGRRTEALTTAQEAVDLRRELVALNRDAYLPNLAASVNNLAIRLAEAGRRTEALTTAQEAVDLYRELVALNRDAYLPDLAGRSTTSPSAWPRPDAAPKP